MSRTGATVTRLFMYAFLFATAFTFSALGFFMAFISVLAIDPEDEVAPSSYLIPFTVSALSLVLAFLVWALGVLRRWRSVPGPIGWDDNWSA